MHKLAQNFIPCVQDEWLLSRNPNTVDARFLKKVYRQGHYGAVDEWNYQGTYIITPKGEVLASGNINFDADEVVELIERGLDKWKRLKPKDRLLAEAPDPKYGKKPFAELYPTDGLVLRVIQRGLPDPDRKIKEFTTEFNIDFAWYRKFEARRFLPEKLEKGQRQEVPPELIKRLAKFHFLDHLPGIISHQLPPEAVKKAVLTAEVISVKNGLVEVKFEGETHTAGDKEQLQNGYDAPLLGKAVWSIKEERFTTFELVAVGKGVRGALGFVCHMTSNGPGEKQPPRNMPWYGWK